MYELIWYIISISAIGVMWSNSEPTTMLREVYIKDKSSWYYRLLSCCLCSTFHISFWTTLIVEHDINIGSACISAIIAEFISRKLNS